MSVNILYDVPLNGEDEDETDMLKQPPTLQFHLIPAIQVIDEIGNVNVISKGNTVEIKIDPMKTAPNDISNEEIVSEQQLITISTSISLPLINRKCLFCRCFIL